MEIINQMRKTGLVPVVVLEKKEDAVKTAQALLAGGIDLMEITFRTEAAEESIRDVAQQVPGMTVGALLRPGVPWLQVHGLSYHRALTRRSLPGA